MRRVIVESPYAKRDFELGLPIEIVERNLRYLRACMHDCIHKGEAPFASHGLYTQPGVLRDDVKEERDLGIQAGFAWREVAQATVVYTDLGITKGMRYGIDDAEQKGRTVEYRTLSYDWANNPNLCTRWWTNDA